MLLLDLLAGLTLVPALLAVLGARVNRFTLFNLAEHRGFFWQRLARWEMRHAAWVLLFLIPLLGLLMWPALSLNVENSTYEEIPEASVARQG